MSKVNRSACQKLAEENKRLKSDIEALVMIDNKEHTKEVFIKWREHFKTDREFKILLKQHAQKYIHEHRNGLPDFL